MGGRGGLVLISHYVTKSNGLFYSFDFAVSLQQCIEVVLHIALKQTYYGILEMVTAVFAELSLSFHQSLLLLYTLAESLQ